MDGIEEMNLLQQKIMTSKARGERIVRIFWEVTAIFAFICFAWLFFLPKVNSGMNNLPFIVIAVFGLVGIVILVAGDMLFFNKTFEWQDELEEKQARSAAQVLGVPAKAISLRRSSLKEAHYVLKIMLEPHPSESNQVSVDTQPMQMTFRLKVGSLKEALELLEKYKNDFTRVRVKGRDLK